MTSTTQIYTIQAGDTITSIASKYGYDWRMIYNHPLNENFRGLRPNPNQIKPGYKLIIPSDPRKLSSDLRERLIRLETIKREAVAYFNQLQKNLDADFYKIKRTSQNIDTAAFLAGIFVNAVSLVNSGFKAMNLSGQTLEKLNKEVAQSLFISPTSTPASVTALVGSGLDEPNENDGMVIAFGKIALKAWGDMTSPSYWAGKLTGGSPDKAYREATLQLNKSREQALNHLDQRIKINRELLSQIEIL